MSNSTPVKNRLIPAVVQVMSVWFVNNGCNFMKFVEWCLVPHILPYGSDVFVNVRFKIRGSGETWLHLGSVCSFGSSIGSLVTRNESLDRECPSQMLQVNLT